MDRGDVFCFFISDFYYIYNFIGVNCASVEESVKVDLAKIFFCIKIFMFLNKRFKKYKVYTILFYIQ